MGVIEFSYLFGTLLVGVLATAGYAVIALTPAEFRLARRCFQIAALLAFGILMMWGATTPTGSLWLRAIIIGIVGAIIAISTSETLRWVSEREDLSTQEPVKDKIVDGNDNSLKMNIDFTDTDSVGKGSVPVSLYFINSMRGDVIIRDVSLFQSIYKDSDYHGGGDVFESCRNEATLFFLNSPTYKKARVKVKDGFGQFLQPISVGIDGVETSRPSTTIAPSKSTRIDLTFLPEPIGENANVSAYCIILRLLSPDGKGYTISCEAISVAAIRTSKEKGLSGTLQSRANRTAVLLPVGDDKTCLFAEN